MDLPVVGVPAASKSTKSAHMAASAASAAAFAEDDDAAATTAGVCEGACIAGNGCMLLCCHGVIGVMPVV